MKQKQLKKHRTKFQVRVSRFSAMSVMDLRARVHHLRKYSSDNELSLVTGRGKWSCAVELDRGPRSIPAAVHKGGAGGWTKEDCPVHAGKNREHVADRGP